MKHIHYDNKTKKLIGMYNDIPQYIPTPTIEITDEAWEEALKVNANCVDVETKTLFKKDFRTQEEIDEANRLTQNREALKYLSDTDWYVIRYQETGEPIPQDILATRAEARNKIVKEK